MFKNDYFTVDYGTYERHFFTLWELIAHLRNEGFKVGLN